MIRIRRRAAASRSVWLAVVLGPLLLGGCARAATPETAPGAAPPRVTVVHAWKQFLAWRAEGGATAAEREAAARRQFGADPWLRAALAARAGGDFDAAVAEIAAHPPETYAAVAARLADPAVQRELESGASDLLRRLGAMPAPSDSVVFVFLVGGFHDLVTHFDAGGARGIAAHLEAFVPLPDDLSDAARESAELAQVWRPDRAPALAEVMPWAAYAYARVFVPELRRRLIDDTANLAEYVLARGVSARLAAALYPESVFGAGLGPVSESARTALAPRWREIGAGWFPLGGETYLVALLDDRMSEKLPEGATLDEAVAVVGARLAREWLDATRIGRVTDEPAEISRLGRVPTLNAWKMLEQ